MSKTTAPYQSFGDEESAVFFGRTVATRSDMAENAILATSPTDASESRNARRDPTQIGRMGNRSRGSSDRETQAVLQRAPY